MRTSKGVIVAGTHASAARYHAKRAIVPVRIDMSTSWADR
jgi:hypothetical protein